LEGQIFPPAVTFYVQEIVYLQTEAGEQTTLRKQVEDEVADAKKSAEKLEQEMSDLKAQLTAALKTSAAPKVGQTFVCLCHVSTHDNPRATQRLLLSLWHQRRRPSKLA
jgi:phage shock protein A